MSSPIQHLIRRTVPILSVAVAIAMLTSAALAEHEGKVQILLLGDSTTEGSIPRLIKPEGPHLESVIEQLLAAEKDLPPSQVINSGVGGEYIRRLIDSGRYDRDVAKLPGLDYIFIRYGLNDRVRVENFAEEFPKHFHELIDRLRKDHPQALLIPMTVIPYGNEEGCNQINDLVRQVAEKEKLEVFDIYPRYSAELANGPNMLNYRRYPSERVPDKYQELVAPFIRGGRVVVIDNELDSVLGHLPGWYGDRHPNLAGYNVIADETAKYLATIMRADAPKGAHTLPNGKLASALTLHASFDKGLDADFSTGDKICYVRRSGKLLRAEANDDAKLLPEAGRFGGALHFPKKSGFQPTFKDGGVLGYSDDNWSTTVSVWLKLNPDLDLEPGYCDPIQIVGDNGKKGFIFLEFSKDETPRYFRYAIRPLFHIWNPDNVSWADLPFDKRPMVQVERPPFTREEWTHVVFTLENVNDKSKPQAGRLYINGELQGAIENWDLTFGWDPSQVLLVLGASYVGHMDDLGVFNRVLDQDEVKQLYSLKNGIRDLHPAATK
ncbi:GDSL-type esterase/lipase family protein [Rosistilla oblonga]|uniref:GDSL-type esterase/lipase family protein n=1 Tax=Rosistilla oblonga TaxID=2527990 RepID=UPI003A986002